MTQSIRCHYDILEVPRDADEKIIKKAHRKKALKYHPDKNYGDEEAAKEFRLVQQAYECLSDPQERKYYDEHRESILRGIKPGDDMGDHDVSYLFDVTPYHFSGCYDGYGDGDGGFFQVYKHVFQKIMEGEAQGWISEGNIDEMKMSNRHIPTDFGDGSTEWKHVSHFYNSWESFSSCLTFAWADKYDPREADSRWVRRRIDDENKKARKVAKKERNEDIVNFVAFVKKRDPRVKAAREKAEQDKIAKEAKRKEEAAKKKEAAAIARETWLLEREEAMREAEEQDLDAGRIRLADLDDSDDDYDYGRGKGKKGKKKGKRGKKGKKKRQQWSSDEEEDQVGASTSSTGGEVNADGSNTGLEDDDIAVYEGGDGDGHEQEKMEDQNENLHALDELDALDQNELYDETSEEESEEEPEVWKCEICRKTFKSEKQLENHLKSKKHKEAVKKWQKKNQKKG